MLAMQTGAGIIPQKPQDGPTTLKISDFTKPSKPEQPEPQPGTERRN